MAERMTPVACERCGHNMWAETVFDGENSKTFTLSCRNEACDNPPHVEHLTREPVTAFLCGPGSGGGPVTVGHVWGPA